MAKNKDKEKQGSGGRKLKLVVNAVKGTPGTTGLLRPENWETPKCKIAGVTVTLEDVEPVE